MLTSGSVSLFDNTRVPMLCVRLYTHAKVSGSQHYAKKMQRYGAHVTNRTRRTLLTSMCFIRVRAM
jgi:hypothetical protein